MAEDTQGLSERKQYHNLDRDDETEETTHFTSPKLTQMVPVASMGSPSRSAGL